LKGLDDEALACGEEALRVNPDNAEVHYYRSFVHLSRGDYAAGWPEFEWRLKCKEFKLRQLDAPKWDGSPLEGRTLVIVAEQGLGDTLHFIRYVRPLQAANENVYVEAPSALVPLLKASGIKGVIPGGSPLPRLDVYAPLLSLPGIQGTTLETVPSQVPYLAADPRLMKLWRGRLRRAGGLKVGIVWQGNVDYMFDHLRSIPLAHYAALAGVTNVRLVSLQKGPGTDQLPAVARHVDIIDLGNTLDAESGPFMDTAAIMCNLDLTITSDTAAAHLAGGLGVPVWLALSSSPEWRWMTGRADSPWYPTMRLFRQESPGDWEKVFSRMKAALAELARGRAQAP
jgi:hypothetical protein